MKREEIVKNVESECKKYDDDGDCGMPDCERSEAPDIMSLEDIEKEDHYREAKDNKVEFMSMPLDGIVNSTATKFPPWVIRYNELVALFGDDEDLIISPFDNETRSCDISSWNYHKIKALSEILKDNEFIHITFTYLGEDSAYMQTLLDAFAGNPHLNDIRVVTDAATEKELVVVAFKNETIQYPADNRFVPGGYETTLAEKLVKDLVRRDYRRNPYITVEKAEPECYEAPHDDDNEYVTDCDFCNRDSCKGCPGCEKF